MDKLRKEDAVDMTGTLQKIKDESYNRGWKQGMTDAADMLFDIESSDAAWFAGMFKEFILKARDAKGGDVQ